MKNLLSLILLCLGSGWLLAACSTSNELVVTDTFEGVIFSQENAAAERIDDRAEGYWTPSMDGGPRFFEVKYNPQTEDFFDLSIHGQS